MVDAVFADVCVVAPQPVEHFVMPHNGLRGVQFGQRYRWQIARFGAATGAILRIFCLRLAGKYMLA